MHNGRIEYQITALENHVETLGNLIEVSKEFELMFPHQIDIYMSVDCKLQFSIKHKTELHTPQFEWKMCKQGIAWVELDHEMKYDQEIHGTLWRDPIHVPFEDIQKFVDGLWTYITWKRLVDLVDSKKEELVAVGD